MAHTHFFFSPNVLAPWVYPFLLVLALLLRYHFRLTLKALDPKGIRIYQNSYFWRQLSETEELYIARVPDSELT